MRRLFICIVASVMLIFGMVAADASQKMQGEIMQVKDGDTVVISPAEGGQFFICRLYGIDAPETARRGRAGQPHGEESTRKLKQLVLGQTVDVKLTGRRTHNREVCIIRKNGQDINLEMVRLGYAWAFRRFLEMPHASEYISAENEARKNKRGLWKDTNPTPPWEFRKLR
jgi:endonuclease YncB( thermonuclease family)